MNDMSPPSRRGGGRDAKRAARLGATAVSAPFINRKLAFVDLMDEESLAQIEENAEVILSEIGCEFRDDPEALEIWKAAGAEVTGELVRMPRGMCRQLIQDHAPREFVHHARNPARSTTIGGKRTVFAPTAGPPFVRCLDKGRRYGTIEDFNNFAKLTQASPWLHSSATAMCEPVDLPVNKRHFDMFLGNAVHTDKPFFSAVSQPHRSEDCVEMAKILFGDRFVDPLTGENNTCLMGVMNGNSPLTFDATMLGAAKALARANQGVLVTPFIMAGAMAPTGLAGAIAVTLAEAMAGMAFLQLVKPGAPVIFGSFVTTLSMQSGAPTYGTPETTLMKSALITLARRLGVPSRTGGSLCASKIADAQAGFESTQTLMTTVLGGANFVLQSAGWLEGGLVTGYEKFVMDCDQLGMMHKLLGGYDMSENGQAMDAIREVGPGKHFFGCAHTQANFETAFYRSPLADYASWEQWEAEGALDIQARANKAWKKALAEHEDPALDEGIRDALVDYIARRKSEMPDANY